MKNRNTVRLLICSVVLLYNLVFLHAQSGWTIFNTQNSGLPDNNIRCLAIDGQNRKWLGMEGAGMAMYNDTSWTVYTSSNSGLPDNYVKTISVDEAGNIWIGMLQGGLARFDGQNWQNWNTLNSGLPDDFVRAITFDTIGNIWLGTTSGLVRFDGINSWQVWHDQNSALQSNNIAAVSIGRNNVKYLATINGGLYDFNDTTFAVYTMSLTGIPDNSSVCIAIDTMNTRWYASPAAGLMVHYDFNFWNYYNVMGSGIGSNALNWVIIDSLDTKYICSMQRGVTRFQPPFTWTIWDTLTSPMPDGYAQCVAKENNHIVWVGTREGGLVRIDESPTGIFETSGNARAELNCFPNPASPGRTIAFSKNYLQPVRVQIINMEGQTAGEIIMQDNLLRLPADLASGIYIIEIYNEEELPDRYKLLVK